MAITEICRDGIQVRLFREDDRLFLQVGKTDSDEESDKMPCDPDILCAVLRGMTYQLASVHAYCAIRRVGSTVTVEYQSGSDHHTCRLTSDEYAQAIAPALPARLRASLL